ncbi:MAG: hypothetical protein RL129_898 [Actinomycetota bacterium]|jgi:hypothetical protein
MSASPLVLVRQAHLDGASTRKEIVLATALSEEIVDLCVDLLIETGEITIHSIKGSCTIGGCKSCAENHDCQPRNTEGGPIPIQITKRNN